MVREGQQALPRKALGSFDADLGQTVVNFCEHFADVTAEVFTLPSSAVETVPDDNTAAQEHALEAEFLLHGFALNL